MLLETRGDYNFAAHIESIAKDVHQLNKQIDEQNEINQQLIRTIKELTEFLEIQSRCIKQLTDEKNCFGKQECSEQLSLDVII